LQIEEEGSLFEGVGNVSAHAQFQNLTLPPLSLNAVPDLKTSGTVETNILYEVRV
jgi:hypothetical protein